MDCSFSCIGANSMGDNSSFNDHDGDTGHELEAKACIEVGTSEQEGTYGNEHDANEQEKQNAATTASTSRRTKCSDPTIKVFGHMPRSATVFCPRRAGSLQI